MDTPFKDLPTPSESETLANLHKVRRDLMDQLNRSQEEADPAPRFSMFSSPRNYRKDELHNGLSGHEADTDFSNC